MKVLIVDDMAMNRILLKKMLQNADCEVDQAESGSECLSLIGSNDYEMIFLDQMMPDMDGMETFYEMHGRDSGKLKNTSIVMMTADSDDNARQKYIDAGFDDFLCKPVSPESLNECIKRHEDKKNNNPLKQIPAVDVLPEIDGFVWDYARLHLGKNEVIIFMVREFMKGMDEKMNLLNSLYENIADETKLKEYQVRVHGLKSSSALMGATVISALSKLLEYAARDRDFDRIYALHSILMEELCSIKSRLKGTVYDPE